MSDDALTVLTGFGLRTDQMVSAPDPADFGGFKNLGATQDLVLEK